MLSLARLPKCVQLLVDLPNSALSILVAHWKREGIEAPGLGVARPILQCPTNGKCPSDV
jgi:hypothetical protein